MRNRTARLLPPYAALLRSLVTRQGELAVTLLQQHEGRQRSERRRRAVGGVGGLQDYCAGAEESNDECA